MSGAEVNEFEFRQKWAAERLQASLGFLYPVPPRPKINPCDVQFALTGQIQCDCWQVLERDLHEGDRLPNHVGLAVMQRTCEQWVQRRLRGDRLSPPFYIGLSDGATIVAPYVETRPNHLIEWRDAREWALPVYGGTDRVVLVLRQWIEDERAAKDDAGLRDKVEKLITSSPRWEEALKGISELTIRDRRCIEAYAQQRIPMETFLPLSPLIGQTQAILRALGLPHTEDTALYAFQQAFPAGTYPLPPRLAVPKPSRGVSIETLCLLSDSGERRVIHSITSGGFGEFPGSQNMLFQTASAHEKWWKKTVSPRPTQKRGLTSFNRRPPNAELRSDVAQLLSGRISKTEVYDREKARRVARRGQLNSDENKRAEHSVDQAISIAKKLSK